MHAKFVTHDKIFGSTRVQRSTFIKSQHTLTFVRIYMSTTGDLDLRSNFARLNNDHLADSHNPYM
jgi:hypothetical protein